VFADGPDGNGLQLEKRDSFFKKIRLKVIMANSFLEKLLWLCRSLSGASKVQLIHKQN